MLVAVLDVPRAPADWPKVAARCAPWVDVFILRAKTQPAATQSGLATRLVEAVGGRPVLVADRLDVAMALGVAGVHLPDDGLAPSDARRLWPSGVVSRAVHSVEDVDRATGADWLVFGHLFPTRSKPGLEPRGLELAAQVVRRSRMPVVGIGGVDPARARAVHDAGLAGVAVVDALWLAPDPESAARELAAPWVAHGGGT
ncbi:MAG: thiamine phosphate synthase [Thermaerobacter sp.]|nr:thiamine phosphate synthase [Thermaerobacter sp.]